MGTRVLWLIGAAGVFLGLIAMACSGDAIAGCGTPDENQIIGISEECVREKHFEGCELLLLPHPPGIANPDKVFDVDDEGKITVWYVQPKGSSLPTLHLTLQPADGLPDKTYFTFGREEDRVETSVSGVDLVIDGDEDGRTARWESDCADYQFHALGDGGTDALDAVLLEWLNATLE